MQRRIFLSTVASGIATLATAPLWPRGVRVSTALAPEPDVFTRPTGWGVSVNASSGTAETALPLLQPARWHTYDTAPIITYPGKIPMLYSHWSFDRELVRAHLTEHPGETMMLSNEPEESGQANESPTQAVDFTLEFIDLAREVANPFQWCSPSTTLRPSGLAWMTEYMSILRQYKGIMRPAYWCIHPYQSRTVAELRQSMAAWWSWYATWGSGAPTVLSEVCAENSSYSVQVAVMNECKAMLNRGEVAGVFWYIANAWPGDPFPNASLVRNGLLTPLGQRWILLK